MPAPLDWPLPRMRGWIPSQGEGGWAQPEAGGAGGPNADGGKGGSAQGSHGLHFLTLLAPLLRQQGKLGLISLRLGTGLKAGGGGLGGWKVGSCWPPKVVEAVNTWQDECFFSMQFFPFTTRWHHVPSNRTRAPPHRDRKLLILKTSSCWHYLGEGLGALATRELSVQSDFTERFLCAQPCWVGGKWGCSCEQDPARSTKTTLSTALTA